MLLFNFLKFKIFDFILSKILILASILKIYTKFVKLNKKLFTI